MIHALFALAIAAVPAGALVITPATIPWGPVAADGTRFALLDGQRDVAGQAFSYAFALPAGTWDKPHRHSTTARIFVIKILNIFIVALNGHHQICHRLSRSKSFATADTMAAEATIQSSTATGMEFTDRSQVGVNSNRIDETLTQV